ncbi:MAG: hypothetical protein HGA19_08310 [Oscillochloris sp.]|nr:hypothetical protein [Oscillochloris sp.]
MKVYYRTYLELPAPINQVAELLKDSRVWPKLPGGWEPLGELWRYGTDLYHVDMRASIPTTLHWNAAPVAGYGPKVTVTIILSDGVIATYGTIEVEIDSPTIVWPWQRILLIQRLRSQVIACRAALAAEIEKHPVPAPQLIMAGVADEGGASDFLIANNSSAAQRTLVEELQEHYPQTVEHFLEMGAIEHLERVAHLDASWAQIMRGSYNTDIYEVVSELPHLKSTPLSFDLIYAGGGLGLFHAAVMAARYGWRVMVFDRSEVGCAHREWNISRTELAALVETGVVSWDDLDAVIMREYRSGLVRYHSSPHSGVPSTDLWLPDVLNVSLDASALMRLMRRKLEQAGGTILSGRMFRKLRVCAGDPVRVEVELERTDQAGELEHFSAHLLLDGMGSTSPLGLLRHHGRPFAGVCLTVGTATKGFVQGSDPQHYDPMLGDILVSIADSQHGEQLIWEGFPGRDDELTIYLFYYSAIQRNSTRNYSMLDLFEQYFTLLPSYKQPGPDSCHTRPVYGYIPARHSLRRQEAPLLRGVLPVGDSAAQQSPLTFCGFGSHVRNLRRTAGLLDYALNRKLLQPPHLSHINAFQTNVSLNWVFSRFMEPWEHADDVNRLQNIFMRVLQEIGVEKATRFFQDRMRWSDYHPMLLGLLRYNPGILIDALQVIGLRGIFKWMGDYVRFSVAAATATLAGTAGRPVENGLTGLAERFAPALGLRLRARYAEWRVMGWIV